MRREAKEKLKDEAKLYFYYSSNKWGQGRNMPKIGMSDQTGIKFADMVMALNSKDKDQLPFMQGTVSLGKEWRYYKRDLDNQKRAKKRAEERAAADKLRREGGGVSFGRPDYGNNRGGRVDGGGYLGKRDFN
jgi:hypothetical protein